MSCKILTITMFRKKVRAEQLEPIDPLLNEIRLLREEVNLFSEQVNIFSQEIDQEIKERKLRRDRLKKESRQQHQAPVGLSHTNLMEQEKVSQIDKTETTKKLDTLTPPEIQVLSLYQNLNILASNKNFNKTKTTSTTKKKYSYL